MPGRFAGHATKHIMGVRPIGWIWQLLILLAVALIIIWMVKGNKKKESAIDILKRRYASGEISEKEFNKIKKEIE